MQEAEEAPAGSSKEVNAKKKRKQQPPVYAPWSEGAQKLDAEMQKQQETSDEKRLASIVSGLGSFDSDGDWIERAEDFVKGPKCLEKLKELQRCLNREDPDNRRIFLQLGRWNFVGKYIVPVILQYSEDTYLFLTALKVAILLTVPVEANSANTFDQVEYLCQFKEELSECNVIGAVVAHLEEPLANMERGSVTEDDWRLLQLILALIQNLLAFPEPMNWVGPYPVARYSQLRDGILARMFEESVPEIVLAIVSHLPAFQSGIRKDNLLLLQVLHHMFWGQKPEELFNAVQDKDNAHSNAKLHTETSQPPTTASATRHSNFAGTFVRVDRDGSKTMLVKAPFPAKQEVQRCSDKDKSVARDVIAPLPSRHDVSVLLKDYAEQFLATGGYNILMQTVKDDIRRERKDVEESDIVVFFRVAEFFTSYQHYQLSVLAKDRDMNSGQVCGYISSTMDDEMFRLVVQKWLLYVDSSKTPAGWAQVGFAGALLKTMVYVLDAVLKCRSENVDRDLRMARTLSYQLFYDQTESGILNTTTRCMKAFNIYKHPRSYLQSMVELTHVALKLIENVIREDGALRVAKKARRKSKKKQLAESEKNSETVSSEAKQDQEKGEEKNDESQAPKAQENVPPEESSDEEHNVDDLPGQETTLDILRCVEKFADSVVVSNYCWLLSFYKSNSLALNHYILCMLHRICKDCDLEPMLYQIAILELFQSILSDSKIARLDEYRPLVSFITKVTRNFFKKLKSCPLLYVDVLFPKSRKLCREISLDYTIVKLRGATAKKFDTKKAFLADALNEEDENEGFKRPSTEVVNLSPRTQTDASGVALRSLPLKRRRQGPFNEEDEARIKELFEQFKEKRSCSKLVAEALRPDGSISGSQVARKLKQLGLHRVTSKGKQTELHSEDSGTDEERNDNELFEDNEASQRIEEEDELLASKKKEQQEYKKAPKRRRLVKQRHAPETRRLEQDGVRESFNNDKERDEDATDANSVEQLDGAAETQASEHSAPKKRRLVKHRDIENRERERGSPTGEFPDTSTQDGDANNTRVLQLSEEDAADNANERNALDENATTVNCLEQFDDAKETAPVDAESRELDGTGESTGTDLQESDTLDRDADTANVVQQSEGVMEKSPDTQTMDVEENVEQTNMSTSPRQP